MEKFYDKFTHKAPKSVEKTENRSFKSVKNSADKKTFEKKEYSGKKSAYREKKYSPKIHTEKSEICGALFDTKSLSEDAKSILVNFDEILNKTLPLNSKQKQYLPNQIRELSHYLTDERGSRRVGYMNQKETLTAYVHYYLWWNLVRLTKLFSNLPKEFFSLKDDDVCLDIGSGPLTVVISLFLARPELRSKKLTFYCMDISSGALSLGENIYYSVCASLKCENWKIIRVKGELGTSIKEKAKLVTSANVFNELDEDFTMPPEYTAKRIGQKITSYGNDETKYLIIEPGTPKSSRLVSLLRDYFIRKDYRIAAPCTHCESCVMNGQRGEKWCNFTFFTEDAPSALKKLSEKSDLPKERAVLSFICVEKCNENDEISAENEEISIKIRIVSEEIKLPGNRTGYYGCCEKGLILAVTDKKLFSGTLIQVKLHSSFFENAKIDEKSGAVIINI